MKKILLTLLLFVPLVSFSQNEISNLSNKEQRRNRSAYIGITSGMSYSGFRDFATSPLFYNGSPVYLSLSCIKADEKRESEFGLSYSSGIYSKGFNTQYNESQVEIATLYYSQLFRLNSINSEKFNIKFGGLFNTTGNFRINESLWNNATGAELFTNIFGSIKITIDLSRSENKYKKFLFLNYKLNPRTRNLSYRLNVGLINTSYRNGYAYTRNNVNPTDINLFKGYQFKAFSGFRMSSALDYTFFLKNKNAIQLSYLWDAYITGGDLDKLEMAHHIFKLTFLFNTNNR